MRIRYYMRYKLGINLIIINFCNYKFELKKPQWVSMWMRRIIQNQNIFKQLLSKFFFHMLGI